MQLPIRGGGNYGGHFGSGSIPCAKNFYFKDNVDPSTRGLSDWSSGVGSAAGEYFHSGSLTVTSGTVNSQVTLYVDGDVSITGDIKFTPIAFTDVQSAPYLAIIAKGNIFINGNVHLLDGVYVAQPDNASNGVIYTCANGFTAVPANSAFYAACKDKLITNGALVAKQLKLMRASGTLLDSSGDYWGAGGARRSGCNPASSGNLAGGSCAAEVLDYSPLVWIGTPINVMSGSSYDSIIGLPPVL